MNESGYYSIENLSQTDLNISKSFIIQLKANI